jgi:protocatechuate 3,4-dioxygenase beta subunit
MKRRQVITGLAALASLGGAGRLLAQDGPSAVGAGACRLTRQDVTGPFYVDFYPDRANLMESQKGLPLTLDFLVRDVMTCKPLPGARVVIWHASADGFYSGVENPILNADGTLGADKADFREDTFLRGQQTTDASGRVQFVTAYPGWYFPRSTHLHVKVLPPDFSEEHTTQLYFPNAVNDVVYATEHYAHRGPNPTRVKPGDDSPVFAFSDGDLWLNLERTSDGYRAAHELGVVHYGNMFGPLTDFYRRG